MLFSIAHFQKLLSRNTFSIFGQVSQHYLFYIISVLYSVSCKTVARQQPETPLRKLIKKMPGLLSPFLLIKVLKIIDYYRGGKNRV